MKKIVFILIVFASGIAHSAYQDVLDIATKARVDMTCAQGIYDRLSARCEEQQARDPRPREHDCVYNFGLSHLTEDKNIAVAFVTGKSTAFAYEVDIAFKAKCKYSVRNLN